MQLTRFADLGLRVLMYLTHERAEADAPVTNAEIASQFQVPHNHVIKVVNKLGKLGWVETQRGRGGGLRLAVPAASLRLGDVLLALEPTRSLVDCEDPPCVLRQRCSLKGALDDALGVFYDTLNQHTLAELCRNRTASVLLSLHRKYGT
jgi:Rrf2 family transcriptional regulator, nitric oxide-sensitive transcriptional repressor